MGAGGRNVTSISQPRNIPAFCPRGVRFSENQALNWGAWRHPASSTLKMRFKSLAAARNWVQENPETRPAKSPRAPAAATPSFHPTRTPEVSLHSDSQLPTPAPATLLNRARALSPHIGGHHVLVNVPVEVDDVDRKSTRLNSSHLGISYA